MARILQRIRRLRAALREKRVEAAVITEVRNVRYLTGFTGDDSALLVGLGGAQLVTDSRYTEQAQAELRGTRIGIVARKKSLMETIAAAVRRLGVKAVAFESEDLSVKDHADLAAKMGKDHARSLRAVSGLVSRLRERKDADEVAAVRRALSIAQGAFEAVAATLWPGMTEREVAVEIEFQMRRRGAMGAAFPTIVAAGPRASLPHARPTDRGLRAGEPIVIDWGAMVDFYCGDLTRTVFLGNMPRLWRRRYEVVLRAQARGIAALAAGVKAARADRAARAFLRRHHLGSRFGHGLGHGVGMAVHEAPSLGARSTARLQPGMIVTVEPGIYLPGEGGIRIEDMVLVRRGGVEVLSSLPKDMESVVF